MTRIIPLALAVAGLMAALPGIAPAADSSHNDMKGSPNVQEKLKGREAYLDRIDDLDDMQRHVTLHDGTEPPFENCYWDHKEEGIYVDVITGKALFSSTDKFDSGTGWPSFTQPIDAHEIVKKDDRSFGMTRTELRSATGDAHLGHVFDDGPPEHGGKRYCINSAALDFIPKDEMKARGYGEYLVLFEQKAQD